MNLNTMTSRLGEWLRGAGPESDVVVSTRIRLARNLAGAPFTTRATPHQKAEIEAHVREAIQSLDAPGPLVYVNVATLPAVDRQFLV